MVGNGICMVMVWYGMTTGHGNRMVPGTGTRYGMVW